MDKKEFRNRSRPDSQSKSTRLESSSSKGGSAKGKKSLAILGKGISTVTHQCKYETATTCHKTWADLLKGIEDPKKTGIVFLDSKYRDNSKDEEKREHSHWMMLAHHAKAVAKTAKDAYTVFFRDAGEHTLRRIVQGCPTKGHEILDKTLKDSSLKKTPEETKDFIKKHDLYGFVGVYDKKGNPIGIRSIDGIIPFTSNMGEKLKKVKELYTGDYDMLDLLNKRNRVVSQGGQSSIKGTEHYFMKTVNDEINRPTVDEDIKPRWHDRWCMVRHGAQALWPTYAYGHHEVMLQGLVRYSLPAMVFTHEGCIHFVETIEEMKRFYDALGPYAHPPAWWSLDPFDLKRQKLREQTTERAIAKKEKTGEITDLQKKDLRTKMQELRKVDGQIIDLMKKKPSEWESKKKKLEDKHKKAVEEFTKSVKEIFYNLERV